MIFGLHPVDFAVLLLYLGGTTALGIYAGRGTKNIADFFMPRRFGKSMMIMSAFGAGTASDQAVTVASATYTSGLSGIWYQWLWLFVTPFYWIIAPIFRRFRAVTTADVYRLRFGDNVAMLFAIVGIASVSVKIGLLLKGTGALIEAGTRTAVDPNFAIIATAVLFVVYGALGGLAGAIVTDFVQGLLTILFSIMLLPLVFAEVGGMQGIRETITDPAMLSLVAPGKITLFFIIMMGLQALVGIVAQPHFMGVCGAGKTELEGRVGVMTGNFIKRFCTVAWSFTAIGAVAWYIQQDVPPNSMDPDHVYGDLAQAFLPQVSVGLLGVFIAALLAGVMSSCDTFMLASAALFTQNVYRPYVTDRSEAHYLWVGRITSVLVVIGGVSFAMWVPSVIDALEIWFQIAPMMGIVLWMALVWRGMTPAGAWAATLTGFAVWFITSQVWFLDWVETLPFAEPWRLIWIEAGIPEFYKPWQIVTYMIAAAVAGVVVSLFTKKIAPENETRFYDLIRTPVRRGEQLEEPCELPPGVEPNRPPLLISIGGFEIARPMPLTIVGFIIGWIVTALLVGGVMWIV